MRYFDTSFLVPIILPEATSEPVAGFFGALPPDNLAVSHWTRGEFGHCAAELHPIREMHGIVGLKRF